MTIQLTDSEKRILAREIEADKCCGMSQSPEREAFVAGWEAALKWQAQQPKEPTNAP